MRELLNTDRFILKSKIKHGSKYDYSLVNYTKYSVGVSILCGKHGEFIQKPSEHLRGSGCPMCCHNFIKPEEFIVKANKIHNNKYDYSLIEYKNNKYPLKIICPKHGIFEQTPAHHIGGSGCKKCSGTRKPMLISDFIKKSMMVHGNTYDYSAVNYINNSSSVSLICKKHGIFNQKPNNHLSGAGCPVCKKSKGEKTIVSILVENRVEFEQQYCFSDCKNIKQLPFDFYIKPINTLIEYDGKQHFTANYFGGESGLKYRNNNDKIKDEYCTRNNIRLIRIKYDEDITLKLKNGGII